MPATLNVFAVLSRSGKRMHADECKKNQEYPRGHFSCIDCSNDVFVRRGNLRAWHFAHYNASDDQKCPHQNGGETLEHYKAKHFIAKNIRRCMFVVRKCYGCGRKTEFVGHVSDSRVLSASQCMAEVEGKIRNTSRVADVALADPVTGRQLAAVEVFHTHKVDQEKWDECQLQGIAVLEVTTGEVEKIRVQYRGSEEHLLPFQLTNMVYKLCPMCAWQTEVVQAMRKERAVWAEYDLAWMHYGERLFDRMMEKKREDEKAELRIKGMQEGKRMLHMNKSSQSKFVQGAKCRGKCKACDEWMFQGVSDRLIEISAGTMSASSWDELFDNDDERYKKKYRKMDLETKTHGYNTLLVHRKCTMECPSCKDRCLLVQLAKYGLCVSCNCE